MTETELQAIRGRVAAFPEAEWRYEASGDEQVLRDRRDLLAEVERLRANAINVTPDDRDELLHSVEVCFDEGMGRISEEVLIQLDPERKSHLWFYIDRDRLTTPSQS